MELNEEKSHALLGKMGAVAKGPLVTIGDK